MQSFSSICVHNEVIIRQIVNEYKQISTICQKKKLPFFWLLICRCSRLFYAALN